MVHGCVCKKEWVCVVCVCVRVRGCVARCILQLFIAALVSDASRTKAEMF